MQIRLRDRNQLSLLALLLCSSLYLLSGCQVKKADKPTPEKAASALVGEWQAFGGMDGIIKIIFQPNGEAWIVDFQGTATKSWYWTNSQSQPMHLDIFSSADSRMTTYEFSNYDTIRILPKHAGLQQLRENITPNRIGVEFNRTSDRTDLDPSIRIASNKLPTAERIEAEASLYLNALIFAQRDYHQSKKVFSDRLSDMDPGFSDDFLGYSYQILKWGSQDLLITAQPSNPNLKSFTALLATGEGSSSAISRCRSLQPMMTAPQFFKNDNGFRCGSDSEQF
jgi:Type IV pilin-like G and H, putative